MGKNRKRNGSGGLAADRRVKSAADTNTNTNTNDKEIAYQNKDIASKVLAESLKGKTFRVYGLDLPEIKAVLPTNIPAVAANELRLDNLFELMDGTIAVVDYESEYRTEDKVKYLNYLTGIANRYRKKRRKCPTLRMIVIYTGDIMRRQVSHEYDIGAVKVTLETAFLSELDSAGIFRHLKDKIEKRELLDDTELMKFIILPLSYRKKEEKEEKIRETVALAAKIENREQQLFTLAGILTFTDKLIDDETANRIRRVIEMTKVARIFEEEKQQALADLREENRQALAKAEAEKRQALAEKRQVLAEKRRVLAKAEAEKRQVLAEKQQVLVEKQQVLAKAEAEKREFVVKMIRKNYPVEEIASIVSDYSLDDIEAVRMTISG